MIDLNVYRIYRDKAEFYNQYDMRTRKLSDGNEVVAEDIIQISYPLCLRYVDYGLPGFHGHWVLCYKAEVLRYLQNKIDFWNTLYKEVDLIV